MDEKKNQQEPVYTHDLAAECVELFENILDAQDVTLTSPEDNEKEEGNGTRLYGSTCARLYGSTYSELLDNVEDIFVVLLKKYGVPFVEDEFSGTY